MSGIFTAITGAISGITGLIDDVVTSDEERMELKNKLSAISNQLIAILLGYEQERLKTQASIVEAEAKGESWLQRNWRPIVMLTFAGLVVASFLGFKPEGMTEKEITSIYEILKLGIGGYVIGRSAEKVVKEGAKAARKIYEAKVQ